MHPIFFFIDNINARNFSDFFFIFRNDLLLGKCALLLFLPLLLLLLILIDDTALHHNFDDYMPLHVNTGAWLLHLLFMHTGEARIWLLCAVPSPVCVRGTLDVGARLWHSTLTGAL